MKLVLFLEEEDGTLSRVETSSILASLRRKKKYLARATETDEQRAARLEKDKDIMKGLEVWDKELGLHGFAVPPRVWKGPGRNGPNEKRIMTALVERWGIPDVAETMRSWLKFRAGEKLDATLGGFNAAFERAWQRRRGK